MNDIVLFDESKINAIAVFANKDSIDPILKAIEQEVTAFVPDISTDKGRKHIASLAHKVARSKVALDDAGKNLVAGGTYQAKVGDDSRKHAREFLDSLKDRVRQPLTDWENEQARIAEEKRIAIEKAEAEKFAAIAEAARIEREKMEAELAALRAEKEARDAEARRIDQERIEKERVELAEKARIANEERIRRECEEKARRDAEEAVIRANEAAAKAERDRIAAEERAKIEQANAVRAERERMERIEREKQAAIDQERRAAEKLAANKAHRSAVNNAILVELVKIGVSEDHGKKIITAVIKGQIKHLSVNY